MKTYGLNLPKHPAQESIFGRGNADSALFFNLAISSPSTEGEVKYEASAKGLDK